MESLANGVVVLDADERAVLVNPVARGMGVLAGDRLAFDELTRLVRTAARTRRAEQGSVDLPMGRLGREPIALAATAVPLPAAGSTALLLDDVTDARRLDAVRRDFVANVSHELKTPVGALSLLAEAVQDAAGDPEAVDRFSARMQHEATRLGRLVRELLELSRLEGAEALPGDHEVAVIAVLDEAFERTRMLADECAVTVVVHPPGGLVVRGNEAQLSTAVANLIDNAVTYSPSGSQVTVSAHAADGMIDIVVSDEGTGIAEADLTRVFERFYRVDQARSRATGGTGLGLAIVKHVAANHGGSVSARSVEGAGSTFTVRLPAVHLNGGSFAGQPPVSVAKGS